MAAIRPAALVLSFEPLMRQLRQQLSSGAAQSRGNEPHVAASVTPAAPQLNTQQIARGAGRQSLLDKARHIHADQERHGTRLTGKTPAALLGISEGYARRRLRDIDREPATAT